MNKCILFFGCVYCSFFQCMGAGPTVKDSEYAYTGINETKYTNLLSSLRNKNKITTNDCKWLCDFVLKNNSEVLSEEIGYLLFNKLKDNTENNTVFLSYIERDFANTSFEKENIKRRLMEIMCIDITDNYSSCGVFVVDFLMFNNSPAAKQKFYECVTP